MVEGKKREKGLRAKRFGRWISAENLVWQLLLKNKQFSGFSDSIQQEL